MTWRCFHCGEVCKTHEEGLLHFGADESALPACRIDAAHVRELEAQLLAYRAEDTDLHREIYAMRGNHARELVREEERGYAKGLADARKEMQS